MQHREFTSTDAEQTEAIARLIGAQLKGGEVIELVSDLGGGKTTFTRGLAMGAGSKDVVASPTFTVSKLYKAPAFEIHHFDFYRLGDAGLIAHELQDLLDDPKIVIIIEWGDIVEHVLPEERVTVRITQTGDESRHLSITCPVQLGYLLDTK